MRTTINKKTILVNETKRSPKKQLIAPILVSICLAIMLLLNWSLPLMQIIHLPFSLIGLFPIVVGLTICLSAQQQFKQVDTNLYPFNDPEKLVTNGLFRHTRNPMYLGLIIFLMGVGIMLGSFSPMIIVATFFLIADRWYISYEEKRLTSVFGKVYENYQAKTPRWI